MMMMMMMIFFESSVRELLCLGYSAQLSLYVYRCMLTNNSATVLCVWAWAMYLYITDGHGLGWPARRIRLGWAGLCRIVLDILWVGLR